jgi:hypothetical protein
MALAATGDKTYTKKFHELICIKPDGEFSVSRDFISYDTHGLNKPFKNRFIEAKPKRSRTRLSGSSTRYVEAEAAWGNLRHQREEV